MLKKHVILFTEKQYFTQDLGSFSTLKPQQFSSSAGKENKNNYKFLQPLPKGFHCILNQGPTQQKQH